VKIPDQGGVFPIVAQGEGTKQQCGVILASEGEAVPKMPVEAELATAGLDNTQELRLRAKTPLPEKAVARSLPCVLGGNMAKYHWTIDGAACLHSGLPSLCGLSASSRRLVKLKLDELSEICFSGLIL
jgi:hypothetical protein